MSQIQSEDEVVAVYQAVKNALPAGAKFLCTFVVEGINCACSVGNAEPDLSRYFMQVITASLDQEEATGKSSGVVDLRQQGHC